MSLRCGLREWCSGREALWPMWRLRASWPHGSSGLPATWLWARVGCWWRSGRVLTRWHVACGNRWCRNLFGSALPSHRRCACAGICGGCSTWRTRRGRLGSPPPLSFQETEPVMDDDDADLIRPRHRPHRSRRFPGGRPCACPSCRTTRKRQRKPPDLAGPSADSLPAPAVPLLPPAAAGLKDWPTQIDWTRAAELVTRGQLGRAQGIARVEGVNSSRTSAHGTNSSALTQKETRHHDRHDHW